MILNFRETAVRIGERGVSAGRLAGPWGIVLRRREEAGRDKARFMPYGGEHHAISRIEDLPEIECPHCGREMVRLPGDLRRGRPPRAVARHKPGSIEYVCACGWGFEVSPVDLPPAYTAQRSAAPLMPYWPDRVARNHYRDSAVGRTWQVDPTPKEIAARAAVLRAFRARARELAHVVDRTHRSYETYDSREKEADHVSD